MKKFQNKVEVFQKKKKKRKEKVYSHHLKYFQNKDKRESIYSPFEVVLPHKDIGHPSPSRRWPGQPDHNGDDDGDGGVGDVETGENSVMTTWYHDFDDESTWPLCPRSAR